MEITYKIEPEDFVAFNLSYIQGSKAMRSNIRNTRMLCSAIILVGGCLLMQFLGALTIVSVVGYVALAAAAFFALPWYLMRRVRKGVLRMLSRPENKEICSEKTLSLGGEELSLTGGGEDSHYSYTMVERITEDDGHYFIYVGPMAALIVPFRAFATGEDKAAFYKTLCERVQQAKKAESQLADDAPEPETQAEKDS